MKRAFPQDAVHSPLATLRRAGYTHFTDPVTNEQSFILRLTADYYPRFHLYVEEEGNAWSFNLHLDQKKASYSGSHKHSGEYTGETVEREMERLSKWVAADTGYYHPNLAGLPSPSEPSVPVQESGPKTPIPAREDDLFGGIFG